MTKKQKKMVARLVGSAVFFIVAMMLEKNTSWAWIPFVLSYLAAGYDIPLRACRKLPDDPGNARRVSHWFSGSRRGGHAVLPDW